MSELIVKIYNYPKIAYGYIDQSIVLIHISVHQDIVKIWW